MSSQSINVKLHYHHITNKFINNICLFCWWSWVYDAMWHCCPGWCNAVKHACSNFRLHHVHFHVCWRRPISCTLPFTSNVNCSGGCVGWASCVLFDACVLGRVMFQVLWATRVQFNCGVCVAHVTTSDLVDATTTIPYYENGSNTNTQQLASTNTFTTC